MPHNRKGPADANRWAFEKFKWTFPIVPLLHPQARCCLRQLATVYREAVTSEDPRVTRLGLQVLWRCFRSILELNGE